MISMNLSDVRQKDRQRAKRRSVRIWASQYSQDTGCMYFRNPRKVGDVTCFDYYCRGTEAWSEPK